MWVVDVVRCVRTEGRTGGRWCCKDCLPKWYPKGLDYSNNKIFDTPELFPLFCEAQQLKAAGKAVVVNRTYTTLENLHWGIDAGKVIDVVFVWTELATDWFNELPAETQQAIIDGDFNSPGTPGFPYLGTFSPKPDGSDFTAVLPEQGNLYASLTEWSLRQSEAGTLWNHRKTYEITIHSFCQRIVLLDTRLHCDPGISNQAFWWPCHTVSNKREKLFMFLKKQLDSPGNSLVSSFLRWLFQILLPVFIQFFFSAVLCGLFLRFLLYIFLNGFLIFSVKIDFSKWLNMSHFLIFLSTWYFSVFDSFLAFLMFRTSWEPACGYIDLTKLSGKRTSFKLKRGQGTGTGNIFTVFGLAPFELWRGWLPCLKHVFTLVVGVIAFYSHIWYVHHYMFSGRWWKSPVVSAWIPSMVCSVRWQWHKLCRLVSICFITRRWFLWCHFLMQTHFFSCSIFSEILNAHLNSFMNSFHAFNLHSVLMFSCKLTFGSELSTNWPRSLEPSRWTGSVSPETADSVAKRKFFVRPMAFNHAHVWYHVCMHWIYNDMIWQSYEVSLTLYLKDSTVRVCYSVEMHSDVWLRDGHRGGFLCAVLRWPQGLRQRSEFENERRQLP